MESEDVFSKLRNAIYKFISEYDSMYQYVVEKEEWKNPFRDLITQEIPGLLKKAASIESPYILDASYGKGRWTKVPWIAVFDQRITKSAQKGVYIVYLLNKETKELYLVFEIAATEVMGIKTNSEGSAVFTGVVGKNDPIMKSKLQLRAEEIRNMISDTYFCSDNKINSGAAGYDSGAIYYKKYTLDNLPPGEVLAKDLEKMMGIYRQYYDRAILKDEAIEESIVEEYGLEISEESEEDEMLVTTKDAIDKIKSYIAAKGFHYDDGLIENFFLSMKSKPFVILAGTSGTGKTRLVKLFAEAIGATLENGRYKMVPVRPDWSDSSDLFGHVNLNGKFVAGAITDFVYDASENLGKPYFLCLDEMNLARVEYYMSDILSVIESRDFSESGEIVTAPLMTKELCGENPVDVRKYADMRLPGNLYIVGTVNMDETTFPFSRKVLDRANTIEFSNVDLIPQFEIGSNTALYPLNLSNDFLKTEYMILLRDCMEEQELVMRYCSELQEINKILLEANAHVGYRVRDEIIFYLLNNHKAENLISEEEAMDNEIMQKILPRIQGSSVTVRDMLVKLFKHCAGYYAGIHPDQAELANNMLSLAKEPECKYKKSAEKIAFMIRRYEEDGFTSYWL